MAATVQDRALADLAAVVTGLALAGEAGVLPDLAAVYQTALPDRAQVLFPCVLVGDAGLDPEEGDHSDFENEHVVYRFQVSILDQRPANVTNWAGRRAVHKRWRHEIARKVRGLAVYPLLPQTPEAFDVKVGPAHPPPADAVSAEFYQQGLSVEVHATEPRVRTGGAA